MIRRFFQTFLSGFLMGSADVVPGVSGGTIALVLGIYERLVATIRSGSSALGSAIKGDFSSVKSHFAEVEWGFLGTLLAGILVAVLTLAQFISNQLDQNPIILAAAFFGLVVGSIVVAFGLIKAPSLMHGTVVGVVGVIVFVILGFGSGASIENPSLLVYFGSGALAICAMILPGISGSLILVLIGTYEAVLTAVTDRNLSAVGVFVLGAVVGLGLFSQVLYRALRKAHDPVLAVLIGLMAGSLRILWPWPDGVEGAALGSPNTKVVVSVVAGLIGFAFVTVIAGLSQRLSSSIQIVERATDH
jgi:putative membrane protein